MPTIYTTDIIGAAEILHTDKKTVEALIHSGAIPAAQPGRRYVMLIKHVLEYLEQSIIKETAERMKRPKRVDQRGRTRAS